MHDTTAQLEVQTFDFEKGINIDAPIEITWDAVLAELGPEGTMPDETGENVRPYPFVFEPWPGGRWYRDLGEVGGNTTGHLWGHVQVIKPPKLLEIVGPTFLSYPGTNHIQYRLTAEDDSTHLKITNRAFGYFPKDYMTGAEQGWAHGLKAIAEIAARMKQQRGAKR
jgi:uncharacterized protein YndB with AHSA1/START domain